MTRHILDTTPRGTPNTPLARYARAAHPGVPYSLARKLEGLRRRAKGTYNPSARLRAYLRIERTQGA